MLLLLAATCLWAAMLACSESGTPLGVLLQAALKGPPQTDRAHLPARTTGAAGTAARAPILLIASGSNPFSSYLAEILRNEGLNEFTEMDVKHLSADSLAARRVVIVGEISMSGAEASTLCSWVREGGSLIVMRPGRALSRSLQIETAGEPLRNAYLSINPETPAGRGLVTSSIQFHGEADLYRSTEGLSLATLYRDATHSTANPAVLLKKMGAGQVAVFAYDLARSVVYTRQGNPAWSGMERDGIPPVRSDDLFYGGDAQDMQPDWVDMSKVDIPQADEQQRLFANLVECMTVPSGPLPRFWYFPRELKAVVIMTGDDHGHGGTIGRFQQFAAASPRRCSMEDWQCIRGTSNIFLGSITPEDADAATRNGFEIGLHIFTNCQNWPSEETPEGAVRSLPRVSAQRAGSLYSTQLAAFGAVYPHLPSPTTSRTDCIAWGDFDSQPQIELAHGIRLDTNYYYWPLTWVKDRPGMFTGSGMPMRFARMNGGLIDVYQAATQMTDESGQSYPRTIDTLLDNALGPEEYYGAFTANIHTDSPQSKASDDIVASAARHGVPVIAAQQMLRWLDGRNGSSFVDIAWSAPELHFTIAAGAGSKGLVALLPMKLDHGPMLALELDGMPVAFHAFRFAGIDYAAFPAAEGRYVARYQAAREIH